MSLICNDGHHIKLVGGLECIETYGSEYLCSIFHTPEKNVEILQLGMAMKHIIEYIEAFWQVFSLII